MKLRTAKRSSKMQNEKEEECIIQKKEICHKNEQLQMREYKIQVVIMHFKLLISNRV